MRILVAAAAAIVMLGSANAQSLEESYAKLCPQPAVTNVEACSALQHALIAKQELEQPQSRTSKSSAADPTWGLLARLVNTAWAVEMPGMNIVDRFAWIEDGAAIKYTSEMRAGMNTEIVFRPSPERGTLSAQIDWAGFRSEALFRLEEDRLVSDWYLLKIGKDQDAHRREITLTHDGQYGARMAIGHGGKERPEFPIWGQQYKSYSEEGIAQVSAEGKGKNAMIDRMVKAKDAADAEAAKAAKAARRADRAAMFGAALQGLAQGAAEVNTGGYAEAQANLDATVANIQYAADVERQQQALAAQQEQARAAEANRQQLAENARWVAEKEQAAAEYRDGETQAAEARKAQLALKQQEDGQRRTAAEADRRKAQQDALREQGGVRAQATASGSLVLESVVNPSRRESTPPNSTADRQMLVACFLVHHGEFDQGKGVVFFSSTVPVAMEKGLAVGDPTGTFRRKVKSSYNIDGGTACQTLPDAAGLQSFMQEVGTSYRRYRKIDTGLSPLE